VGKRPVDQFKGERVKRALLSTAVVALMLVAGTASAGAANGSAVSANVDSIATLVISGSIVNFDFDLYNCPAGSEIVIVDWTASEPDRPDAGAAGTTPIGISNGDQVQHLSLSAGASGFLAGEKWVGSGQIACGAVVVPVAGSGATKSLTGV
jgi:hypothetical protein